MISVVWLLMFCAISALAAITFVLRLSQHSPFGIVCGRYFLLLALDAEAANKDLPDKSHRSHKTGGFVLVLQCLLIIHELVSAQTGF